MADQSSSHVSVVCCCVLSLSLSLSVCLFGASVVAAQSVSSQSGLGSGMGNFTLFNPDSGDVWISNSVVQSPHRLSDTSSLVVASTTQPRLTLRWRALLSPASFSILTFVDQPGILSSLPTFSVGESGTIPSSFTDLSVNMSCATRGVVSITAAIHVTYPTFSDSYVLKFSKACTFSSCPDCGPHGTCVSTGTADTGPMYACKCDAGYDSSDLCRFQFTADRLYTCPGELNTVSWSFPQQYTSLLTVCDWIGLFTPASPIPGPPRNFTQPEVAQALIYYRDIFTNGYFWQYVGGSTGTCASDVVPSKSVPVQMPMIPATYALAYMPNNLYVVSASLTIVVRDWSHPQCATVRGNISPPAPVDPLCSGRGSLQGLSCVCNSGFFGRNCEKGCGALVTLNSFGTSFSSSVDGSPFYLNNAACSWLIQPSFAGATGVVLNFDYVLLDRSDSVQVFRGNTTNPRALVQTFITSPTSFSLRVNATVVLVTFVSDYINPSGIKPLSTGFLASYRTTGCSAGNYVTKTSTGGFLCQQCPSGSFTSVSDQLMNCTLCPTNTFAQGFGNQVCTACPFAYFSFPGSAQCVQCRDASYVPFGCPPSPLFSDLATGFLGAFGAVVAIVNVTIAVIVVTFRHRTAIKAASANFMLIFLSGCFLTVCFVFASLGTPTVFSCNLKPWFLAIGFQLAFGSLFLKTYRLHRVFNNTVLAPLQITNNQLYTYLGVMILMDVGALVVWMIADPYRLTSDAYPECTSSYTLPFGGAMFLYQAVIIILALYYTFRVRKIPSFFNESKSMAWCVYNVMLVMVFLIVVYVLTLSSLTASSRLLIVAICVLYFNLTSCALLFVPKLRGLLKPDPTDKRYLRVLDSKGLQNRKPAGLGRHGNNKENNPNLHLDPITASPAAASPRLAGPVATASGSASGSGSGAGAGQKQVSTATKQIEQMLDSQYLELKRLQGLLASNFEQVRSTKVAIRNCQLQINAFMIALEERGSSENSMSSHPPGIELSPVGGRTPTANVSFNNNNNPNNNNSVNNQNDPIDAHYDNKIDNHNSNHNDHASSLLGVGLAPTSSHPTAMHELHSNNNNNNNNNSNNSETNNNNAVLFVVKVDAPSSGSGMEAEEN